MTAPTPDLLLIAKRRETAYLHGLVTRQAQTIDELLSERDVRERLIESMLAGRVPGLTTAADLTSRATINSELRAQP